MVSETKTLKSLKTILFLSCIIQSRFSSTSYSKRKEKCRFCFDPLCSFRETAHIRRIPVARVQSVSAATRNYSSRLLWRVRVVERVIEEEEEEESYARIERAKKRSRRRRSRIENPRATAQRLPRARNNNRATFAGTTPVAASFRMPCMIGRDEPCPQMLHLLSSATVFVGDGSFHFPPEQAIFESVETGCWESGDFPISTRFVSTKGSRKETREEYLNGEVALFRTICSRRRFNLRTVSPAKMWEDRLPRLFIYSFGWFLSWELMKTKYDAINFQGKVLDAQ